MVLLHLHDATVPTNKESTQLLVTTEEEGAKTNLEICPILPHTWGIMGQMSRYAPSVFFTLTVAINLVINIYSYDYVYLYL